MATYIVDKFEFGSNTYIISDSGALQLTGGTVTGPVSFRDSISVDDATLGNLVVNGSASFTNNLQVNKINEVAVGASPKFTDTVTTVSTTGSGNAVTAISASNGALTITKGTTFLTSHQDISGKADKSATVSTVTYDSTNKKLTKTINGTTTDVVTVATLKTAMDIPTYSSGTGIVFSMVDGSPISINHSNSVTAQTTQAVYPIKIDAQGHISAYGSAVTIPTIPSNNVTGSGTSGYLAKFSGANAITNGPQLGTSTTTFLRNDGTWATPHIKPGVAYDTDEDAVLTDGLASEIGMERYLVDYEHVFINGSQPATWSIDFYAPTASGTSGQYLKSNGSGGTPTWANFPTISTEAITIPITKETGTTFSVEGRKYGNIIQMTIEFTNTSSVASASDVFKGTITNSTYRPKILANGAGYYTNHALVMSINTDGKIIIRNAGSTAVTISSATKVSATWII